jgi:AcrR family transcriptional regulator
VSSRSYDATRRQQAAQRTRRRIAAAASELFVKRGYAATTVAEIAAAADVAPPTVAAAFGGKAGLLKHLIDVGIAGDDAPVPMVERDIARQIAAEPDPRQQCELLAEAIAGAYDRLADLLDVSAQASGVDEQVRADLVHRQSARRSDMLRFVELIDRDHLCPGVDREEGADIVWALTDLRLFIGLVRERGWSVQRYTKWLTSQLASGLLR